MIKHILSFKNILFLLLLLSLLSPIKISAYNTSTTLYRYEQEVLEQISQRKEEVSNTPIEDILAVQTHIISSDALSQFYAHQIFNRLEKRSERVDILTEVLTYTSEKKIPKQTRSINEYIYTDNLQSDKVLTFSQRVNSILKHSKREEESIKPNLLPKHIENVFASIKKDEIDRYEYFQDIKEQPKKPVAHIYTKEIESTPSQILNTKEKVIPTSKVATSSTTVTFSLTILPVRFVYVNSSNEIVRIFNNVKKDDSKYVLKYFNDNNKEIRSNENLNAQYIEIIKNIDVFQQGVIYDKRDGISVKAYPSNISVYVDENSSQKGEIYTLL